MVMGGERGTSPLALSSVRATARTDSLRREGKNLTPFTPSLTRNGKRGDESVSITLLPSFGTFLRFSGTAAG
jgi:hypothetical protein